MSRIANNPVTIPAGVEVKITGQNINIKGSKGQFDYQIHQDVSISHEENQIKFVTNESSTNIAITGTMRALVNNMVVGVSQGFEKRLNIVGIGYRAKVSGKKLDLNLGFSHPVEYFIPEGIEIEAPSNTELVVKGADKQLVGQVAANIRSYRPPEPYKGKGVRYSDELVIRKVAKKK